MFGFEYTYTHFTYLGVFFSTFTKFEPSMQVFFSFSLINFDLSRITIIFSRWQIFFIDFFFYKREKYESRSNTFIFFRENFLWRTNQQVCRQKTEDATHFPRALIYYCLFSMWTSWYLLWNHRCKRSQTIVYFSQMIYSRIIRTKGYFSISRNEKQQMRRNFSKCHEMCFSRKFE